MINFYQKNQIIEECIPYLSKNKLETFRYFAVLIQKDGIFVCKLLFFITVQRRFRKIIDYKEVMFSHSYQHV